MSAFLAIASREVTTRSRVLAVSLVIGLGTLLVPVLVTTGASPAEMRGASGWLASLLLGLGVAVLTGSALFGAPLADGRAGFWLSRPASPTAIWSGKLAGAFVLVVLANAIAILPAALSGTSPVGGFAWPSLLALDLGACLLLLFAAAAASTSIRSRSAWIAADILLLGLVALLGWNTLATLAGVRWFILSDEVVGALAAAAAAVLAAPCLALATWAAVAFGRTDIRLAHRAQAIALWAPLVSLSALALATSLWWAFPPPSALLVDSAEAANESGSWVLAEGSARYRPQGTFRFLVEPATGRTLRLDRTWRVDVSADGSRAVFNRIISMRTFSFELVLVDLRSARFDERVVPAAVFPSDGESRELSPDGSKLAFFREGTFYAIELPSGRLLGTAALPEKAGQNARPRWRGDSILLLPQGGIRGESETIDGLPRPVSAWTFDLATRRLSPPVPLEVAPSPGGAWLHLSPDRSQLLVRRSSTLHLPVDVVEAASGRRLYGVLPADGGRISASGFLSDGSLLAVERSETATLLRRFMPGGKELPPVSVPGGRVRFAPASEVRPGLLAASVLPQDPGDEAPSVGPHGLVLFDVAAGTLRRTDEIADSIDGSGWYGGRGLEPPAGSPAASLFLRDGRLLRGIPGEGPLVPLNLHRDPGAAAGGEKGARP